jgi:hypothetical protein
MHTTLSRTALTLLTVASALWAQPSQAVAPETIDRMVTGTFGGYEQSYVAGGSFLIFPFADYYVLNDGSTWDSGAGSQMAWQGTVSSVEREGSVVKYTFQSPPDGVLYAGTDFSFGDHSAQGVLGVTGPLVLTATIGSTTGVMSGYVTILSNEATFYDTFNYYSAKVGQSVYFETTYTLSSGRFTRQLFSTDFTYNETGFVDFTNVQAVPEPNAALLLAGGLPVVWGMRQIRRRRQTRQAGR